MLTENYYQPVSRLQVYKVATNGDVLPWEAVLNGAAYVFSLMDALMARYGIQPPQGSGSGFTRVRYEPLWALRGTGKLSWADELCLATVYPGAWFAKEHLPVLIQGLRAHAAGLRPDIHPSIANVVRELERLAGEDCRGVAFDPTNRSPCIWEVDEDPEGEGSFRPYNLDKDAGEEVWEAGAELRQLRAGHTPG